MHVREHASLALVDRSGHGGITHISSKLAIILLKYPILFGVADIIEGKMKPLEGLKGLMNFPTRMENYDERF